MVTSRKTSDYLRGLIPGAEYVRSEQNPALPPESMQLLKTLTAALRPRRILEIGTNVGMSGITMLNACACAELRTVEMNEQTAAAARENFFAAGLYKRAHVITGRAEEVLPYMSGSYELIFLDGPKGQYEELCTYLLPLLSAGGVLVCDNVLFRGMVTGDKKVTSRKKTLVKKLDAFLRSLYADESLITTVLPIGDGVSISYKKAAEK